METDTEKINQNPIDPATASLITLDTLLQRYLTEISSKKSPVTQRQEMRIANHLASRLGTTVLSELTPLALTKFRDTRLQEASAGTVARDLALLSLVVETAMQRWDLALESNPLNNVAAPPTVHGRGRQLKAGERARLLAACSRHSNPMPGWIVSLIMETGMRKVELLNLQQSQVDPAKRVAHVPKTGTWAARDVPLNAKATKIFQEALLYAKENADTPLIFFGEPGKFARRKPYAVDRVLRQILSRARLKAFGCDDLRDDTIFRMQEAGLTEQEIVAITGLRSIRIDRRAAHLQVDVLIQRLDQLFYF